MKSNKRAKSVHCVQLPCKKRALRAKNIDFPIFVKKNYKAVMKFINTNERDTCKVKSTNKSHSEMYKPIQIDKKNLTIMGVAFPDLTNQP